MSAMQVWFVLFEFKTKIIKFLFPFNKHFLYTQLCYDPFITEYVKINEEVDFNEHFYFGATIERMYLQRFNSDQIYRYEEGNTKLVMPLVSRINQKRLR